MNILLVNFGGPRSVHEIAPFLTALLQDKDVIRTWWPRRIHNAFFARVAKKRAAKIQEDYELIGGKSPIYFDTENIAKELSSKLSLKILTFHRYLPATHSASLAQIAQEKELLVLPLFPQFCYGTTGSIARFFSQFLPHPEKLRWIRSYAGHPAFIQAHQKQILLFLAEHSLNPKDTALLFSAHGVPQSFIDQGDPYETECNLSYRAVIQAFPEMPSLLAYQSKFGRGEWLRPYTNECCENPLDWCEGRKNVVIIPLSFTSDHIETLFEIEKLYLPLLNARGLHAYRCPALNLEPFWIDALASIAQETSLSNNESLIRKSYFLYPKLH